MKKAIRLSDGRLVWLSASKLKMALHNRKRVLEQAGNKQSLQSVIEGIADQTGVSFSAIKHWMLDHNAPSDPDKVRDLARALGVDMEYLLDFEVEDNVGEMINNGIMMNKGSVDYSSVKAVVRSIYVDMSYQIELFRAAALRYDSGFVLQPSFQAMYGNLMSARLDIPKCTFDRLCSFAVNYLQQLGSFLEFLRLLWEEEFSFLKEDIRNATDFVNVYSEVYSDFCLEWGSCLSVTVDANAQDCKLFEEAMMRQYEEDDKNFQAHVTEEIVIDVAYERLEEILRDYMIP